MKFVICSSNNSTYCSCFQVLHRTFPHFTTTTVKHFKVTLADMHQFAFTCFFFFFFLLELVGNFNICALPLHSHANLRHYAYAGCHTLQHCTLQSIGNGNCFMVFLCESFCFYIYVRLNVQCERKRLRVRAIFTFGYLNRNLVSWLRC